VEPVLWEGVCDHESPSGSRSHEGLKKTLFIFLFLTRKYIHYACPTAQSILPCIAYLASFSLQAAVVLRGCLKYGAPHIIRT
jgi:hypothetical protein